MSTAESSNRKKIYMLQAKVTLRRTLRDMAQELSQSTGSLISSTSESLSTKSDQSRSVSSLNMNGGNFLELFDYQQRVSLKSSRH